MTIKVLKYVKINSINPPYLIFGKVNGYFEEVNGNKYLTLVTTNESKEIIQKYEELWSKINDLIRSITKNLGGYDEKDMKIKFDLDDDSPLNKTIEIATVVVTVILYENNKYYLQVFLDKCLYKYKNVK